MHFAVPGLQPSLGMGLIGCGRLSRPVQWCVLLFWEGFVWLFANQVEHIR